MTHRSRKQLNLARAMSCKAKFPHQCTGWQGCEPAHTNMGIFGKGKGLKAPDWAWASMCHNAHAMIDHRAVSDMDNEQKHTEWMIAFKATQDELWETGAYRLGKVAA